MSRLEPVPCDLGESQAGSEARERSKGPELGAVAKSAELRWGVVYRVIKRRFATGALSIGLGTAVLGQGLEVRAASASSPSSDEPAAARPVGNSAAASSPSADESSGVPPVPNAAPDRGTYVHLFGGVALGRGIRFNNPYRLATVLGRDAESLSLTATYADLGFGATLGDPFGLQHGMMLRMSLALDGVAQEVLSPSYVALQRLEAFMLYGRAGTPIVLSPDSNLGLEVGLGAVYRFSAMFGATAELVGSLFYGAATLEEVRTVIPMVSLQAGLWVDYEVLP